MNDWDDLVSGVIGGRGNAVRRLFELDPAVATRAVVEGMQTDRGEDLLYSIPGILELIIRHDMDVGPWLAWLSKLPAQDEESDFMVAQGRLLSELVEWDIPGCWEFLWDQVRVGTNGRALLSQCRFQLPAEAWVALLPILSDADVANFCERHDTVWFRVSRRSARVRDVLKGVDLLEGARYSFSSSAYDAASNSASRFAHLRDALLTGRPNVQVLLIEGLWDASSIYRGRCVDLVEIDRPEVQTRVDQLRSCPSRQVSSAARRRFRTV
ncbi:MAG: hypothetical protein KDC87_06735 [Planctomycetes bacterium]|nr:hypothetical protein [Planctomycetota bacterium]MCB9869991.1 hypothetical protein [Planctomycetota bacterium]